MQIESIYGVKVFKINIFECVVQVDFSLINVGVCIIQVLNDFGGVFEVIVKVVVIEIKLCCIGEEIKKILCCVNVFEQVVIFGIYDDICFICSVFDQCECEVGYIQKKIKVKIEGKNKEVCEVVVVISYGSVVD